MSEQTPVDPALKRIAELVAQNFNLLQRCDRYQDALHEIAANRHGFQRPAGAIAKAALDGKPLPKWGAS